MVTKVLFRRAAVPAAAALALTALSGATASANVADETLQTTRAPLAQPANPPTDSVTLVTGDKVMLDPAGRVQRVAPASGRAHMPFTVQQFKDHLYVTPQDAEPLIARGTLDRRLFDVQQLVAAGYGDSRTADLPVIVTYAGTHSATARRSAEAHARPGANLPSIGGEVLRAHKSAGPALWNSLTMVAAHTAARTAAPGIAHLWLDGRFRAADDPTGVAQTGAPSAWAKGYDGTGVKVAVLDTGIDATHPDLKDAVAAEANFTDSPDITDRFGHGTHVASTIAGTGVLSGGAYRGMAPGVQLLVGKVLGDDGSGDDAAIIAGMQWAVDQGARVVNMSLGSTDSPGLDPVETAVNDLTAQSGALFVIAAGNFGPKDSTLGSPGSAAAALTVGAVDHDGVMADFSSRGPDADGNLKPDITAPGKDIVGAKAAEGVIGDPVADGYVSLSGTSMATPHVTGAAALIAQQHPEWEAGRIKAQLMASAHAASGVSAFAQGTGQVDVARALTETVTSSPTSIGFGLQQYPHDDDQPMTRQITYTNAGDTPVTLDLSAQAYDADGVPAAPGMFTVGPASVIVPAAGQATAEVTVDTRVGSLDGDFGGAVTASSTDGTVVARTAVGVQREQASYNLTLKYLDASGAPAANVQTYLLNKADQTLTNVSPDSGEATVRMLQGQYSLNSLVLSGSTEDPQAPAAILLQPQFTLDHDTTLLVDARQARPVQVTVPDPAARQASAEFTVADHLSGSPFTTEWSFPGFDHASVGLMGDPAPADQYSADYTSTWHSTSAEGAPVDYHLDWRRTGTGIGGLTETVSDHDLAAVPLVIGTPGPWNTVDVVASPILPFSTHAEDVPEYSLPLHSTQYFLRGTSIPWHFQTYLYATASDGSQSAGPTYEADPREFTHPRPPALRFGAPVLGPSLPQGTPWPGDTPIGAYRSGDELSATVPLFDDSPDHFSDTPYTSAHTTLTSGGQTVFDAETALTGIRQTLPERDASYRLTTDVTRDKTAFAYSSRVTAAWTFRSAHLDDATATALPLSVVRFSPLRSSSSAGARMIRFAVQSTPTAGKITEVRFEVSYDHGRTWLSAPVAGGRLLLHEHPGLGTVSLRAHVTDSLGGTLTQTVYDALATSS